MKLNPRLILRHWKMLLAIMVPVCLLPIPILDGTVTFRCAYVGLVMAVYWYELIRNLNFHYIQIYSKNGPSSVSFSFIFGLFKQTIQNNVKNVYSVSSARIWTHNILIMSLLIWPLDTRPGLPLKLHQAFRLVITEHRIIFLGISF